MRKEFYIIVVGLVAVFSLAFVSSAQAGTLTEASTTPDTLYGGRVSSYAVSFKVASSTEVGAQIRLIFPAGFDVSGSTATTTITMSSTLAAAIVASSTVVGQEITLWLADGAIAVAADTIHLSGISAIQSPYAGGSLTLGIETRTLENGISDDASATAVTFAASPKPTTKTTLDKIAPTSILTTPSVWTSISAGQEYVIKGISSDAGGSSVQKVEVSVDNGQTWLVAESDGDFSYAGSYEWKYVWKSPTAGEYTVRSRATDAKLNVESPSAGVKVTVTGASVSPTPTPAPPPAGGPVPALEKPIAQMTASELQAKITQLQQQVVALLMQLVQLLTAQL